MNALGLPASPVWVERLGWTLLHFIWQGTAVAIFYAAGRAWLARGAAARYCLGCAALAVMMAAPVVTWEVLGGGAETGPVAPDRTATIPSFRSIAAAPVAALPMEARTAVPTHREAGFLPWVVGIWMLGAMVLWIRLMCGWAAAAGARATTSRPAPAEWQRRLDEIRARMRVARPVRLLVSAWVQSPVAIGWLRPMVLAPVGALSGLPAEYLEALLIHELAHIRRQDYLVNLLQSAAEALLFYHPAVWWISGHIRAEREACCDDIAVRETGDVVAYASALLEMESQRAGLRLAMAASGGSLADRVARLLGESRPKPQSGPGQAIAIGAVLLAAAYGLFAQPQEHPAFQVASIKPNTQTGPNFRGVRPEPGGRLTVHNAPLLMLIQNAYQLQAYQVIGGPEWVNTDGYDIEAKPDHDTDRPEMLRMLQTLLADRFKLAIHRETRELPVYGLAAAKGGLRMPPPKDPNCGAIESSGAPQPPAGEAPCGRVMIDMSMGGIRMLGRTVEMSRLVEILAAALGRPVLDRTGFSGKLDVSLKFTRDEMTEGLPGSGGSRDPSDTIAPGNPGMPNIAAALEEQLGLKLEKTKGPVEVVVIDHVERPTAN